MRAWSCLVVILVLAGAHRAEAADDHAEAKAVLAAQVRALDAHDAKAFAATFDPSGIAILPTAAEEGRGAAAIEAATKRWLAGLGKATIKLDHPSYGRSWFDAELVVTPGGRLRITAVVVSPPDEGARPRAAAVHISEPVADKDVLAAAAAGTLPALPSLGAGATASAGPDTPSKIASFAGRLNDDPAVAVIGSAPAEYAVGPAAVTKLLASWRSLKLSGGEQVVSHDHIETTLTWIVGHTEAAMKAGGKAVKVPYRVLLLIEEPQAVAADRGASSTLMAAHFSVATR